MLRSTRNMIGCEMLGVDGHIGHVHDLLFEDDAWQVRYLVVDTGTFLPGRKVLIIPDALERPRWNDGSFPLQLSKEQVKDSPEIDVDKPVSRQNEELLHAHYQWMPYWGGVGIPAMPMTTPMAEPFIEDASAEQENPPAEEYNPHLRSLREVSHYTLEAADGSLGHFEDIMADDESWACPLSVVDTRDWLPGRKVMLPVQAIERFDYNEQKAFSKLKRSTIKNAPEIKMDGALESGQWEELRCYYGDHVDLSKPAQTPGGSQ